MAEKTSNIRCTGCGQPFATVSVDDAEQPSSVFAALPRQGAAPSALRSGVVLTMRLTALEGGTPGLA
jgi:hypothetical protein